MKDDEYYQSIQNLAGNIIRYSDRDFLQFSDGDVMPTDETIEHITNAPEIRDDWMGLEAAATLLVETYGVEYTNVMADVWTSMLDQDPNITKHGTN